MRKFTKSLLTLALLVFAVGGAKSRTNVDMSAATASANATWTSGTNTFAWTAENEYIVIPGLSGDLTGCYLDFTISGECHLDIVDTDDHVKEGGWSGYGRFGSGGSKRQDLGFMVSGSSCDITKVKEVRICSQSASGSITVTDVSVFYPVIPQFNAEGVATIDRRSLVASGGFTFDSSTGVVTSDGKTTGRLSLEFADGVNLTGLKRYDVNITGSDATIWRSVVNSQGTSVLSYYGSKWGNNLTDAERAKALSVSEFFWESQSAENLEKVAEENLTFTINSITLTADKMNVVASHDVPIASLPHYTIAADGTVSLGSAISTDYGKESEQPLGDGSSKMDEYIDLADYDELRIYTSENARVFFINAITSGTSGIDGATAKLDNSEEGQVSFTHNTSEGYYSASISAIKDKYNGHAKVIGLKGAYYQAKLTVSKIQVYKENPTYDFILSGQYSSAIDVSAVTSSTTATAIDCSNLIGSANPNCMFKANSGVLSNTKNVIVGSTCANLELTDAYPFKAPATFTATNAMFKKTISSAEYATMVVPFDVASLPTSPSTVTAYNLTAVAGEKITSSSVDALTADKPVLIHAAAGNYEFTAAGVSITATADGEVTNGLLNASYAGTTAAVNNYVLQKHDTYGVNFYQVKGTAATMMPFRAYLVTPLDAPVLFLDFGNEATSVNDVRSKMADVRGEVYNLNGQRVAQPTKGLYIVNGKKVVIK